MAMIKYEFNKNTEVKTNFEFAGSLTDMCEGIVKLVEEVLENYADKHPTEPKEYVADIVKRKLAYDIKNLINRKYNMDDLFERTMLDMDKE